MSLAIIGGVQLSSSFSSQGGELVEANDFVVLLAAGFNCSC